MNEITLCHGITLFLGNFTAITTISNIQCVYKWNVRVRFQGDEEGDLKVMGKYRSLETSIKCHSVEQNGNEMGSSCF